MLKFRNWVLPRPLLHPPWGVQARVSESWLFWFVKRAVVHKNSSSGAERCLGHGGWASPLPGPVCIIQPVGRRTDTADSGRIPLTQHRRVWCAPVVSVLAVIDWSVLTAGAEKSIHTSEHGEGHVQKLRACSTPRAKQVVWLCQEVHQNGKWGVEPQAFGGGSILKPAHCGPVADNA